MDCDVVTVVGNLLKHGVVRKGDTCTFLYLDGKSRYRKVDVYIKF